MLFPYRNIVILTGAGISAESGIRTFRDQDGLWENHHIEDVATPEGYRRNPSLVQDFYNQRRQQLESGTVAPNAAHLALAKLERELNGNVTVVTQNIDNLHEAAGTNNIIHMHGELLKAQCSSTGRASFGVGIYHWMIIAIAAKCRRQCDRTWCGLVRCLLVWTAFMMP